MNKIQMQPKLFPIAFVVIGLLAACSNVPSNHVPSASAAFLRQVKQVPAGADWSREVVLKKQGTLQYEIQSTEAFGVTLVTERAYDALKANDRGAFVKSDVVCMINCPEKKLARFAALPPGTYWFIIENKSDRLAKTSLVCW